MDFDHARGEKSFVVSNSVRHAVAVSTIIKEIHKCDLVCSNCHRERTHKRRMAAASGIEPKTAESESAVFPLTPRRRGVPREN